MDINTLFGALTVIVGGICVMVLVSTKTLRDSRDDQEKRIVQLEAERLRDKAEIGALNTEVKFWRSAATGDAKLDKISALLDRHHGEAVRQWVQVSAALGHIGQTLDQVVESIDNLVTTLGGDAA